MVRHHSMDPRGHGHPGGNQALEYRKPGEVADCYFQLQEVGGQKAGCGEDREQSC